jgi:hypothetical protein
MRQQEGANRGGESLGLALRSLVMAFAQALVMFLMLRGSVLFGGLDQCRFILDDRGFCRGHNETESERYED